ncbi:Malate dehydrogenase (oxaloacetate decarboxylating) (NADP+) [Shewanella denitrificans OS217]|jgi:malate dehydrogenase (oxaloacetate-decarboxylating)|uniref:NAD-dependent malic enzyme n=1 Tax=Shewanella denitrificans (strain OS217 / ATCC BAA-1090 / DSM 15013) TaxID=318161 RepID=MAO1_SHEDO|nr:NAD-dependent malic enzyme [Shewanella denitrificans]Q12RA0.1 RecName: Full=NAD-dependent malic enzyme; Short=NAD-ME [Shewanella denitrificans OS217]ABE54026.1 Malate dehydrogenase (oxaloacetate decarboxylating) (NADP+) [Shewanella denitrificans OS217]
MDDTKRPLYLPFAGPAILEAPLINKGSAFSEEERIFFNLEGLLPYVIETIEEQAARAYAQFSNFSNDLDKHIYLRNIQDTNETLFYRLVRNNITEMMPIIYTPTVGLACERFSKNYRRNRGLFISYSNKDRIDDILNNSTRHKVKVIVVTDGERILGLGDQGIGGMGIPIGKLSLYTSCGGISPAYTLPITLDVGTDNQELLDDPMYMGWRHRRIEGQDYADFVEAFMEAVHRRWPDVLIQFEDFAQRNAMPLLERYKDQYCCFNDDIQGTAAVTVGSLLAASKAANTQLSKQRVVFLGAGSAGCGIAEAIVAQMISEGISEAQARSQVFMVDRLGLLQDNTANLLPFQQKLAQSSATVSQWHIEGDSVSLLNVINNAKPTVLIGVSGSPGQFTEAVIRAMHLHCPRPIVFPLSNPTSRVEATPEDVLNWTNGQALVATGSPFEPVTIGDETFEIAQCNNSFIFPGIGLGVLACRAKRVSDEMLMASSRALAECSPLGTTRTGSLLPKLDDIQKVSKYIAFAVAKVAMAQGLALPLTDELLNKSIEKNFWEPKYRRYKRTSF